MTDEELWAEHRHIRKELAEVLSERAKMRRKGQVYNQPHDAALHTRQLWLEHHVSLVSEQLRTAAPPLTHDAMGHPMPNLPEIVEEQP